MGAQLVGIEERLDRMDAYPRRWLYVGLLLGVLLIVAQVGTPFLNAALIQVTGGRSPTGMLRDQESGGRGDTETCGTGRGQLPLSVARFLPAPWTPRTPASRRRFVSSNGVLN